MPWSELLSRPIEITIEDLHVILTSSECYERQFVKNTLIDLKKQKVQELLNLIEVSKLASPFQTQALLQEQLNGAKKKDDAV